jgi:hypothetical protein
MGGGAPLIAGGGESGGRRGGGGEAVGMAKRRRPWLKCRRRGLGADVRTVRLTGGPHVVLIFLQFIQNWLKLKIQMGALSCSKSSQFLHAARLGYYEQFSQLCRHLIPNINRSKNPGSDSTFESLMNFIRGLNLPEKSGKFRKILS